MDFHRMKRKQLQSLCKKHGIPANKSNREMANLLSTSSSAFPVTGEERSSIGRDVEILDKWNNSSNNNHNNNNNNKNKKKKKKVRFSPVNETREYEPTPAVRSRRRRRNVYVVGADPAVNCTPSSCTIGKSRAEEAVGRDGNGKGVSQVVVGRKRRREGEKIDRGNFGGEEKDGGNEDEKNKDGEGIVRWKLRGRKVVILVNGELARQESAGEVAEPGKGIRRSIRKAASQGSDSAGVLISELVKVGARIGRRNTRSGAQCRNDVPEVEGNLGKKSVATLTGIVGSDGVEVEKVTRKQSRNHDGGVEASVETKDETEKASAFIAPLRRSKRKTVHLGSTLATDYLGNGGAAPKTRALVSEKDVNVIDENVRLTRKASRCRSMVASETIQNDEVATGSQKIGRRKGVLETVQEKEPLVGLGESLVGNHDGGVEAPVETRDETEKASAFISPPRRSKRKTVHLGSTLATDYLGNGGAAPMMPELVSEKDVNVIYENVRLTRNASRCRSMVASETVQNETEKASAFVAPLRRSQRKTVHLGSNLATDYLGNSGAAPKMPELDSEKDVNVIDENVRLTRNASRSRSMVASETIQNDKVAAGSQKIGRQKGVLETVQEKGPLVGLGESLVGNHDGVEASVETRDETEKASAPIAPLRISKRKTVHLGSTLATDYLGNGGAALKMPEMVSEKDVSRCRSMVASETIQNDKVAAGSQKIERRKGILETVQEKGPLVGLGESLVGKLPRLSVRLASEADLVGSSVPSKTAGKKELGMANLQNEIAGLNMQESIGDRHWTSTNHSKEFCGSDNNKGSKSKSSGKRRSWSANVLVDCIAPVVPSEPLPVNDWEEVMVDNIEKSIIDNNNSDQNGRAGLQAKTIDLVCPYVGFSSANRIQSGKVSNMLVLEKGQKIKESSDKDSYDVDHNSAPAETISAPDENNWKQICHNGTVSAAAGAEVLNVNAEGTIGGKWMETNLVDAYTEEITKLTIEPAELNRIANENVDSIDKPIPLLTDSPQVDDQFCRPLEYGPDNCKSAELRVADCQIKVGNVISSADGFPSANHNQSGAPSARQWFEEGQESEQLSLGREVCQDTDDLGDHSADQETEVLEKTKPDTVPHHCEHEKNYDYDNALAADGAENSIVSAETVLQVDVKLLSSPFRTGQICGKKEHEDEVSDIGSKKRLSICPDELSLNSGSQGRDENSQEDQQVLIADCHSFQKAEIVLIQPESLLSYSCYPVVSVDKKKMTPESNSEVDEELCKLRQADALPHSFSEDLQSVEERNPSTSKSSGDSQLNLGVCISKKEVKDSVVINAGKTMWSDSSPKSGSSDMFSMKFNDGGKMIAKGNSGEVGLVHAATDSVSNFTQLISDDSDVLDKNEEVHKIISSLNDSNEEPREMFSSKNEELRLTTGQLEHNFVEKTVETASLVELRCHNGWGTQETVFCERENNCQMVLTFEGEEGNGLLKEETKAEVADFQLHAFEEKIGNQVVEEKAQECECLSNYISVVDTVAKATHPVTIERLGVLEVQNGINSGPDTALGDGEDFPHNGYDLSDAYGAGSDASTHVIADNSEELDETVGRVAESMVEFEMKADKLANLKEDTSELHDGTAGPQVLVEHLSENNGDHIAFPSDALGSMNVEANEAGTENSDFIKDSSNFPKIASPLQIISSSEKHAKHNSGEGTVCANVSFGKCGMDSIANVVSGLSLSRSPGMHNGSPSFTDWEAILIQEDGDHNLHKASIEDSESETQFQDVSNDACEMETISVSRGDNLSEIGQELEQNNEVVKERNGGAEKAVEDWNDAKDSASLKSSGVDLEEYTVEQPDQLQNSVNVLSEENSSELNISFGGEEQLQVEELYTQAVQTDSLSKNDTEEGMKLSEDVLKQDGLTADESLAASCSAVDQDIASEDEYPKDQTQSPSPDETVLELNITFGGEKHVQEGQQDIQALQRDLISKDEGKPDPVLVAEKLHGNPQVWMEEQAADPKYEYMEDLEKQDILLWEGHNIQACIPCKNDNDKSGKAQSSDISSENMIMIKVPKTDAVLDEDSMDHFLECDSSNIKQDTTAERTIADAEEKKALREDVLEQDGSTADPSLASFCLAVDQDIAGEGEYPKCQCKSPPPQKTVSLAKQGSNSLSAKRLISSAMPQKATDASQMKENAPIFKREHFGSLTAPKTLSKRRALEDLKR